VILKAQFVFLIKATKMHSNLIMRKTRFEGTQAHKFNKLQIENDQKLGRRTGAKNYNYKT